MPSPDKSSTNPSDHFARHDHHGQNQLNANPRSKLQSPEQLVRLADLVASGELPLPTDLHSDQLEHLAREVRQRRRRRLVRFIARTLALDIHRSHEP